MSVLIPSSLSPIWFGVLRPKYIQVFLGLPTFSTGERCQLCTCFTFSWLIRYHYGLYLSRSSPRSSLSKVPYFKFELLIWTQDHCYERRRCPAYILYCFRWTHLCYLHQCSKGTLLGSPSHFFSREPTGSSTLPKEIHFARRLRCGSDQKFQQFARHFFFILSRLIGPRWSSETSGLRELCEWWLAHRNRFLNRRDG